jgi:hypothetical protein
MRSRRKAFWGLLMLGEERRDFVALGEVPDFVRTARIEERSLFGSLLGEDLIHLTDFWSSGSSRLRARFPVRRVGVKLTHIYFEAIIFRVFIC